MKIFEDKITCSRCGHQVKLPIVWRLGLEMVFYCPECRKSFLLDYRLGAVALGAGIIAATVLIQLLGYILCGFSTAVAIILFLPTTLALTLFIRVKLLALKNRVRD